MDNYIFTQNGDNNVQIGDVTGMPYHVETALKWALEHNFQSVAAQYSRTLALEVVRLREDNERLCSALQSSKKRGAAYEDTGLTPDETARLRAELDAAQRRADSAVGWADCIVDVMISSRRGIVEERFSALAGYRKWRETDRRGPDAPSKEVQP